MKIRAAEFLTSAIYRKDYPDVRLPEIAFAGRSNVGKSTLINSLLNRKRLVKVSSTPGRTQTINFFRINHTFDFVDLPGYGFAKVPKAVRDGFGPMMERYLEGNPYLACVVHILDLRHRPADADRMMREYLLFFGIRILTVATKSDKLPRRRQIEQIHTLRKTMMMEETEPLIAFSAITSGGKKDIWMHLKTALKEHSLKTGDKS